MTTMRSSNWAALAVLWAMFSPQVDAAQQAPTQDYPRKVVRVLVPANTGGASDIVARVVAERLTAVLNQPFIVENRGGAGGMIGTQIVAQGTPDGHTLLVTFDSFGINSLLFKNLPYDTVKDFAPVMQISRYYQVLLVHSSVGVNTVKDFVALAKGKNKLNFGSPGPASSNRLSFELFKDVAGIDMPTIQYKGGGPTRIALISGEVQVMLGSLGGVILQNVKSGRLTPLAVSSPARVAASPELPTIAETYPGFETQSWVGMFAPAGTPRPIIDRLNRTLAKILAEPGMKEKFEAMDNAEIVAGTPEGLAQRLKNDQMKWGALIRKRNISVE